MDITPDHAGLNQAKKNKPNAEVGSDPVCQELVTEITNSEIETGVHVSWERQSFRLGPVSVLGSRLHQTLVTFDNFAYQVMFVSVT